MQEQGGGLYLSDLASAQRRDGDKICCVHNAGGGEFVKEHTRGGGSPTGSIARVMTIIDPTDAGPDVNCATSPTPRLDRSVGLSIHLLGVPRVERDGKTLPSPRGRKVWGLLAYLIRSDVGASRRHLAELLFEDAEDPLAALRWNLSELRRLLGNAGLRGGVVELALAPADYVDVNVVTSGTWAEASCVPGLDRELLEGMSF